MLEDQGSENDKAPETPAVVTPVQNDTASSSSQPPPVTINEDGVPEGGWKREEPENLRRLSEAMEGWKSKQQEIHRKFMTEFDNLGRDISQMQHDTVNFKSEIDVVKDGLQRKSSMDRNQRMRASLLGSSSKIVKQVPHTNPDVQK